MGNVIHGVTYRLDVENTVKSPVLIGRRIYVIADANAGEGWIEALNILSRAVHTRTPNVSEEGEAER